MTDSELWLPLISWLLLLTTTAVPASVLWYFSSRSRSLLAPVRRRLVPWSGLEVLVCFFLSQLFVPACIYGLLSSIGFFDTLYGSNLDAAGKALAESRRMLWVGVLMFPFQVGSILFIVYSVSGTRPYQLGLTLHRAVTNGVVGWFAWIVLTPAVLCFHFMVLYVYTHALHLQPQEHPLARFVTIQPWPIEWVLLIVSATVFAPVYEEVYFRGVVQQWGAARRGRGLLIVIAACALAFLVKWDAMVELWKKRTVNPLEPDFQPFLFTALAALGYVLLATPIRQWVSRPERAQAVFASSLLFAVSHANVWPTPLPLFVLALGLGFLALRTQSLVAPILVHGLFNGVACVGLALSR